MWEKSCKYAYYLLKIQVLQLYYCGFGRKQLNLRKSNIAQSKI